MSAPAPALVPERNGIVIAPWLVTLIVSIALNIGGFAYTWGTVVTRLDALAARLDRLEKQADAAERYRVQIP